jgi:uncharacterized membrane protein HdeD (DUF308 family)
MDNRADLTIFARNFSDLESLRKQWKSFLFMGILMIVLGFFAIGAATTVTIVSVALLGSLLLIGGIVQTVYSFWSRQWSGFFFSLLAGIIYSVTGFLLLMHPTAGALSLTLLLAAFYIIGGIFRIVGSIMMRFEQWGWALLSGIIKLVLGVLIWTGWPATGLWIFGLFIGIDLIFYGWFWVLLALSAKKNAPISKA